MKKILLLLVFASCFCAVGFSQDSTDNQTQEVTKKKFTRATFNSTRIINMQSVEIVSKGNLQFLISHHFDYFWDKNRNFKQNLGHLFGLNSGLAKTYLSFDYSPTTFANLGIAATGNATFEGWAKLKLLRQQEGSKGMPVSVSWFSMANIYTGTKEPGEFIANRWSFMHQLLIARKISNKLSVQLMPTLIHFNEVAYGLNNSNNVLSIGMGTKYKATAKMNLTLEYARQLNMYKDVISKTGSIISYSPDLLTAGIEINTGGHLFQFYVGNTLDASAIDQLARNNSKIKDGQFTMGFTINRSLSLKKE
jgi:Membrane bound beta barrel domain (DUF5777)